MARENPSWGYRRIHGELAGLGDQGCAVDGVGDPETGRDRSSATPRCRAELGDIPAVQEAIIACDFVVVDLLDGSKAYVLAVIEHTTRQVHVLGATAKPHQRTHCRTTSSISSRSASDDATEPETSSTNTTRSHGL